jgi:alpha-methylacyl-CoA racemase
MQMMYGMRAMGIWRDERGTNLLDSGAHFYDVYETRDGKHVSIGSIEPQFYAELLEKTGLEGEELPEQHDRSQWPKLRERLAAIFRTKTRDEWCAIMEGSDVCFAPVLSMAEAPEHPHNRHRRTFLEEAGAVQAAPAPRFSRTSPEISRPAPHIAQHTEAVLAEHGFSREEIEKLVASGAAK